MRPHLLFISFLTSLPWATPIATITVFGLGEYIKNIGKELMELRTVETPGINKSQILFRTLENKINDKMADINGQLHGLDNEVNMIARMIKNLPETLKLHDILNKIQNDQYFLDSSYRKMDKYVRDFEPGKYEESTLLDFANSVLTSLPNSVSSMTAFIFEQATNERFLQMFSEQLKPSASSQFCKEGQSPSQILHGFMNEILAIGTRTHVMMQAAYMIKKVLKTGNYTTEIHEENVEFEEQVKRLVAAMKPYIAKASSELWKCDPAKHVQDETYIEIKNFLHGFILNKANLDPNGRCRDECDVFTYTKNAKCRNNHWCKNQIQCPKIVNCHYIDSSMTVCSSTSMATQGRRYQYVNFGNGRRFGKEESCPRNKLTYIETYRDWVVWRCSYCYCLCDEGAKYFSERYINLRLAKANITDNKVVIGVRFVKHNKIIHLQVQEGKLLPYGQIDGDFIRWVPPEDYTITDRRYYSGQDYHVLSWEQRGFDLADIMAPPGSVVTGVRFRRVGTRIHLEVLTTPFNFTTGQLKIQNSKIQGDPNLNFKHKFNQELKLVRPDISIRSQSPSTVLTTNKYIQFTNTDYQKDAGQTTVPFFDAQPVESVVPTPLAGVGVFHRGRNGFGGFIAPRVFTFNFTQYLTNDVFPTAQSG